MKKIEEQKLPEIHIRKGRECYLDPIRERLIYITPEETVRQRVIAWLITELQVPKQMITVEEHLSHYGNKSRRRADIVIHEYDQDNNERFPIAIVECKAPGILLGSKVAEQVLDYTDTVCCDYAMITDGKESAFFKYDSKTDKYVVIEQFPVYEKMLDGEYCVPDNGEIPDRIPFNEIPEKLDWYQGWDIGRSTAQDKAVVMVNFWECMLDISHKMPVGRYQIFQLIKDYGVRLLTYGNAGGGSFAGPYRSFLIDVDGSTEFVSIGVTTYVNTSKPELERTAICVAIDNEKTSHHALQILVDDNVNIVGDLVSMQHHGRIAIGNRGSGKVDELRQFVAEKYPSIIDGKLFSLGQIKNNRLWYMDDQDMKKIVENLISYALVRDEYREYKKN